jgi:hypothetical protein
VQTNIKGNLKNHFSNLKHLNDNINAKIKPHINHIHINKYIKLITFKKEFKGFGHQAI